MLCPSSSMRCTGLRGSSTSLIKKVQSLKALLWESDSTSLSRKMTVLIPLYKCYTHSLALLFSPSNLMEPNDQFTYPFFAFPAYLNFWELFRALHQRLQYCFNSLYKSKFLKRENEIKKKERKVLRIGSS